MKGDTDTFRLRISLNTLTLYSQWSKPCQYIYFIQYQYECYCVLFQLHGNGLECPFYRSLSPLGQFCESSLQQRFGADCGTGDVPLFIPECRRGSCRISGRRLQGFPASDASLRFSAMMWTGFFTFIPSQVMAHRPYHMQTIRRRFRLERINSLTVYHVHTIVVMFNNDTSTYGSET